ncbi:hypothetical protein Tco_1180412 [Tanacetum coccineum]
MSFLCVVNTSPVPATRFECCPIRVITTIDSNLRDLGLPAWHIHVGGGVYESEGFGWEVNKVESDRRGGYKFGGKFVMKINSVLKTGLGFEVLSQLAPQGIYVFFSLSPSGGKLCGLGRKGPGLQGMTPTTSSTRLSSNPVSQQPCLPPIRDDWDRLFQPMFDEYFNPPTIVVSLISEAAALRAEVLVDSPMSISINQDATSTSIPSSQEQEHSLIISQGFEESPKTPTFHDDPLNESPNEDSTSHGSSSNIRQIHTSFK